MFRRSGYRFADKNMRQSRISRACSDSERTEHALEELIVSFDCEVRRSVSPQSKDLMAAGSLLFSGAEGDRRDRNLRTDCVGAAPERQRRPPAGGRMG